MEDHRHVGYLPDLPHQLDAVGALRQHQVQQHQAGRLLRHQPGHLLRVPGDDGRVARPGQGVPHVAQGLGVRRPRTGSGSRRCLRRGRRAARRAGSSTAGRVKVNRLPSPIPSLSARMRPPWAYTIPLQMASPSPDPPSSRTRSSPSSCENLRNRWGNCSAGTPTPSSDTEKAT